MKAFTLLLTIALFASCHAAPAGDDTDAGKKPEKRGALGLGYAGFDGYHGAGLGLGYGYDGYHAAGLGLAGYGGLGYGAYDHGLGLGLGGYPAAFAPKAYAAPLAKAAFAPYAGYPAYGGYAAAPYLGGYGGYAGYGGLAHHGLPLLH